MSAAAWSCEHCGRATHDAPRACNECSGSMCLRCTIAHDDQESPCPVSRPARVIPGAMGATEDAT